MGTEFPCLWLQSFLSCGGGGGVSSGSQTFQLFILLAALSVEEALQNPRHSQTHGLIPVIYNQVYLLRILPFAPAHPLPVFFQDPFLR